MENKLKQLRKQWLEATTEVDRQLIEARAKLIKANNSYTNPQEKEAIRLEKLVLETLF